MQISMEDCINYYLIKHNNEETFYAVYTRLINTYGIDINLVQEYLFGSDDYMHDCSVLVDYVFELYKMYKKEPTEHLEDLISNMLNLLVNDILYGELMVDGYWSNTKPLHTCREVIRARELIKVHHNLLHVVTTYQTYKNLFPPICFVVCKFKERFGYQAPNKKREVKTYEVRTYHVRGASSLDGAYLVSNSVCLKLREKVYRPATNTAYFTELPMGVWSGSDAVISYKYLWYYNKLANDFRVCELITEPDIEKRLKRSMLLS